MTQTVTTGYIAPVTWLLQDCIVIKLFSKVEIIAISVLLGATPSSWADSLTAGFTDPLWDGVKIPGGQQCQKFGGITR
jgi:hypothetical protein